MKKINYSKREFDEGIDTIVRKIKRSKVKFDYIVGIVRGGAIPAIVLSHKLGIPCQMVHWSTRDTWTGGNESNGWIPEDIQSGKKILLVDDIWDSGETIKQLVNDWQITIAGTGDLLCENLYTACLVYNKDLPVKPNFYHKVISRKKQPEWFEFWWEKK